MPPTYVVTTRSCVIPHVIDSQSVPSLAKDMKMYIDDILYKDSAYDRGFTQSIREFCSIPSGKICLGFKNKPKILVSRRGHYKLKKQKYEEMIKILSPEYHANFDTSKLFIGDDELIEPVDVVEFVRRINDGYKLFGTEFINVLVDDGLMLRLKGNELSVNKIFDCDCCGDLSEGYLKYLWDINEMNALTYVTIHNYNILDRVFRTIDEGELNHEDLKICSE